MNIGKNEKIPIQLISLAPLLKGKVWAFTLYFIIVLA